MSTRQALNFGHQSFLITCRSPSLKSQVQTYRDTYVKMTTVVLKNSLIDDTFQAGCDDIFINASSSKPSTEHRQGDLPQVANLSACQLCNFSGAFTINRVESPIWNEPKFVVLVHAYGQIFGFYRAHSQRTALYVLPLGRWWWALLHPHIIHHFGSIHTLSYPYIPSCSLLLRESKGGVSSSV